MVDIELPGLGSGLSEGELVAWTVEPGDRVAAEEAIAEVETEKSVVDVPAPVAGTVTALHAAVGDTVETGDVIAEMDAEEVEGSEAGEVDESAESEETADESAAESGPPAPETPTPEGRVFAPPRVRRIARERGVDVGDVEGSGPSGRITEDDVLAASEAGEDERSESSDESEDGQPKSAVSRVGDGDESDERELKSAVSRVDDGETDDERELKSAVSRVDGDESPESETGEDGDRELKSAVSRVGDGEEASGGEADDRELKSAVSRVDRSEQRESIEPSDGAESASEGGEETEAAVEEAEPERTAGQATSESPTSARSVVQTTHHDLAVVPELVAARDRLEPLAQKRGVDLTYLPFLVKSVAAALRDHPALNGRFDEETGEVVPAETYHVGVAPATGDRDVFVVRDVDEKSILEVATAIAERGDEDAEPREGGVTVTDVGDVGGEYVTPAVESGQVAALGVGALRNRAVAEDDAVVSRPTLPLSVAVDRRAVDLGQAVEFTNALAEYLADPTLLLLE